MRKIKFVIVSPKQDSGGSIALHRLCQCLNELGYRAQILYSKEPHYQNQKAYKFWIKWAWFSFTDAVIGILYKALKHTNLKKASAFKSYLYEPIKGCPRKRLPIFRRNTILVYPDIYYGNIFNGKNVVRWLLYYNRYDKDAYGKKDLFFAYREIFNDKRFNSQNRILNISYFDLNLYKQINFGKRSGKCYIIRKGVCRADLPSKFDGVIIDDLSEENKVKAFNQCEYCISYDTQTAYSSIAALCGCVSIIVPEEGKSWLDYRGRTEAKDGIALGFSKKEIDRARKSAYKIRERYENSNQQGKAQALYFAKEALLYFGMNDEQ